MNAKNYCMVNEQSGVCENVILWDGDTNSWATPANYILLQQDITPCKNWGWNQETSTWELVVAGLGQIGYTWDGAFFVTNDPQPTQG